MSLLGLVQDAGTGQLSGTKIWNHVANLIASWACVHMVLFDKITFWEVLAYLACVGTSAGASKFLSMKYGAPAAPEAKP